LASCTFIDTTVAVVVDAIADLLCRRSWCASVWAAVGAKRDSNLASPTSACLHAQVQIGTLAGRCTGARAGNRLLAGAVARHGRGAGPGRGAEFRAGRAIAAAIAVGLGIGDISLLVTNVTDPAVVVS